MCTSYDDHKQCMQENTNSITNRQVTHNTTDYLLINMYIDIWYFKSNVTLCDSHILELLHVGRSGLRIWDLLSLFTGLVAE